jgi:transposase
MLSLPSNTNVYLCVEPIDLRKSFEGLCGIVAGVFQRNVLDGHLFLFINKRRDRIKAMWFDRDGLAIFYKRLEKGRFELPREAHAQPHVTLDGTALAMLLGGVPLGTPRRLRYQRDS